MACTRGCRFVAKALRDLGGGGLLVHGDEPQVVVRDLVRRLLALEPSVEEALEGVPPDRAADREADVPVDRRARPQPLVDLVGRGAAAQHHADDAVAAACAALRDDALAVRAL